MIDPAIFDRGWTNDLIKVETTPNGTDIVNGKPVRRKVRSDYLLCLPLPKDGVPMPVAIIEAKKEGSPASLGLHQAIAYGSVSKVDVDPTHDFAIVVMKSITHCIFYSREPRCPPKLSHPSTDLEPLNTKL